MNLRVRILGLALLSVPLFFSCGEEENTIGLPPENDLGIFFAEIPLKDVASQVWVNDLSTRGRDAMLFGNYQDPHFGYIEANHFTEILLPETNPGKRFQPDAQFDSLVLEMRINGITGNEFLSTEQTLEVYQLADTIAAFEVNYFNNSTQDVAQKLGEKRFYLYPDSVGLNFSETNLPDTADERSLYDSNGDYIYLTRVRLDDAFGEQFFLDMKNDTTESSPFASSSAFASYFKGLKLQAPAGANSGIVRYSPFDSRTRLVMYYTQQEEDTVVQRTVGFTMSRSINYNNIIPNEDQGWMGSDLDQVNSFYEQIYLDTGYVYVQGGTNMFMSLDFSGFANFADTVANPIIQNAVLVMDEVEGDESNEQARFELPNFIGLYVTTKDSLEAGFFDVRPEIFTELPRPNVEYDDDIDGFRVEIPLYLQSIVRGTNIFDQVIIAVSDVDPATGSIRPENRSFRRFIADKDNLRIRLYYTIPDASSE